MAQQLSEDVTVWLQKLKSGETESLNHVMELVYHELRQIARRQMRSERKNHTLCTTGLVNEAYLKFVNQSNMKFKSRAEFYGFASQCMRHILVDHARSHRRIKRHDGVKPLSLNPQMESLADMNQLQAEEICEIDSAIKRLEAIFPRGAQVLQYRLFGGLNMTETAEIINVSNKTVQRDWTSAIAWLRKEVSRPMASIQN